ncbi:uncharacterized protein JN550_004559 [Neoarthrinium moseri]|uniref:uncharacterized protein n=1 Tax=Neoarthrinium moseri TaxID=1658444 RepID=UPI001FDC55F1|nr:uncharacterized protein JN550_004559 [Neoarthrinium moseri]KAI1871565.1 hypothetical protein JN550_004559 [Neoarthrinium moseri]
MQPSDTDKTREFFDGAFTLRELYHHERAYAIEAMFRPDHCLASAIFNPSSKPPQHFHTYQTEYLKVTAGKVVVQVEGRELLLSPTDDELRIPPWTYHCVYPPSSATSLSEEERQVPGDIKVIMSSEKTSQPFHEDIIFLENWYHYLNDIIIHGAKLDLLQLMSSFDAAGSYLAFPAWLPFGRYLSRATGIIIGRYLGSMLGYQPYYRKWTTDWQRARERMDTSIFYRRFANPTANS